jgi:hypothetical protein
MWEDRHADLRRKYKVMMDERLSCQREVIDNEELKNEYIDQLKGNKKLNKLIEAMRRSTTADSESTEALQSTNKLSSELRTNRTLQEGKESKQGDRWQTRPTKGL